MTTATITRTPAIGDILCSTWGYDQTNVDFYRVTKVTACTVTVQKLALMFHSSTESMTRKVLPNLDLTGGEELRRRFRCHSDTYFISIETYATASPWNGQPVTETSYH